MNDGGCARGGPDSQAAARAAWRDLREGLRRFVARRVRDEALAEDLVQEVFLRIHEHIGELRDAAAIAPWAYRIAQSVVVDHARRRRPTAPLDDAAEPVAAEDEGGNINEEVAGWLRPMIGVMPPEYAEALVLTELEGLTQRELAERLGLSLSGAKSRVQRGRRMLEDLLRACCTFEVDARGNVLDARRRRDACGCAGSGRSS